ncbi:MAG: stage V sporulation protein AB [Lachnospiraceae bacterium]|uniref:stage V sporulation protein AB n=1 Tax=Parablautia sp. Marseille-Q6255 TaxID=3039593 RepID=UPI0024BC6DB8|nr:stage V sporulation protein AB [Parablautia sp. Marseille-Q6255]
MEHILLAVTGFASGFIVAGGEVALMIGLGIITRFIGVTHTAKHIRYYEDAILLGALAGTILTVFDVRLAAGAWILGLGGLFMGMFVGGWIMALAEVINVFPVYFRRLGITKGVSWVILAMAAGKTLGGLLHFYMRWGK